MTQHLVQEQGICPPTGSSSGTSCSCADLSCSIVPTIKKINSFRLNFSTLINQKTQKILENLTESENVEFIKTNDDDQSAFIYGEASLFELAKKLRQEGISLDYAVARPVIIFRVTQGLKCGGCVGNIQNILRESEFNDLLELVNPDPESKRLTLFLTENVNVEQVQRVLEANDIRVEVIYSPSHGPLEYRFEIGGLKCDGCVKAVNEALHKDISGIVDLSIDLESKSGTILLDRSRVDPQNVKEQMISSCDKIKKPIQFLNTTEETEEEMETEINQEQQFKGEESIKTNEKQDSNNIYQAQQRNNNNNRGENQNDIETGLLQNSNDIDQDIEKGNHKIVDECTLLVDGMTCASCAAKIQSSLKSSPNIQEATVNFGMNTARVRFSPGAQMSAGDAIKHVKKLGYGASEFEKQSNEEVKDSLERKDEIRQWKRLLIFSLCFTVPLVIIAMFLGNIPKVKEPFQYEVIPGLKIVAIIGFILSSPVQFVSGGPFIKGAWNSLRNFSANMDVLVVLGTFSAYFYSILAIILSISNPQFEEHVFFETSGTLLTFLVLGKLLESIAKGRTSSAIVKLLDLKPKKATILKLNQDGKIESEIEVDAELVMQGEVVKIVTGQRIPADGTVIYGEASVDESMITGESLPIHKEENQQVIGGSYNTNGLIYVRADKVGSDSALSQIVKLVEEAQSQKPKIQDLADRIAAYFVPSVLLVAFISFLTWLICGYTNAYPAEWRDDMNNFIFSFLFGVSVVVIACPCALGLATPTAVMVGTGVGAARGILIKGGQPLETANRIQSVLFDKTGTLTQGKLSVTNIIIQDEKSPIQDEMELMNMVACIESGSEHPIAKAIVDYTEQNGGQKLRSPSQFKTTAGRGVTAQVDGKTISVGNKAFLEEYVTCNSMPSEQSETMQTAYRLENEGKTIIYVAIDQELSALIGLADTVKEESFGVIRRLKRMGLGVYMVTGDNRRAAKFIANEVGIPSANVFAEVLPGEKSSQVQYLQSAGQSVAMVGDGINDSPALTQANVGIAVGAGTDVAMESADIVLLKNRLADILTAIDLSKTTYRRIKLNFLWAFGYNVIAIPLAAGLLFPLFQIRVPPIAAGAAMSLSSVSVLLSSLHLKFYKPPQPDVSDDVNYHERFEYELN